MPQASLLVGYLVYCDIISIISQSGLEPHSLALAHPYSQVLDFLVGPLILADQFLGESRLSCLHSLGEGILLRLVNGEPLGLLGLRLCLPFLLGCSLLLLNLFAGCFLGLVVCEELSFERRLVSLDVHLQVLQVGVSSD